MTFGEVILTRVQVYIANNNYVLNDLYLAGKLHRYILFLQA